MRICQNSLCKPAPWQSAAPSSLHWPCPFWWLGLLFALVETPRVTQTNRHKSPSITTRTALDPANMAQYLEPFVTVIGITLKDVWQGALDANNNLRLISKQTALVDIKEAQAHAECLAQTLVESACTSEKARNIFLPNISLPLIPGEWHRVSAFSEQCAIGCDLDRGLFDSCWTRHG